MPILCEASCVGPFYCSDVGLCCLQTDEPPTAGGRQPSTEPSTATTFDGGSVGYSGVADRRRHHINNWIRLNHMSLSNTYYTYDIMYVRTVVVKHKLHNKCQQLCLDLFNDTRWCLYR